MFLVTGYDVRIDPRTRLPAVSSIPAVASTIRTRSVYANAYLDIVTGRAARYAAQNEDTMARFRAAKGDCVEFPPATDAPETIFVRFVKYPWRWCARDFFLGLESAGRRNR
jgi:hypothetical protein